MTYSQVTDTLNRIQNDTAKTRFRQGQNSLGTDRIDKQAFLHLLMAQLQNQDPMNPVQDNEFLSQQAALAQVEKLDDLNANLSLSNQMAQAGTMVGKYVELGVPNTQTGQTDKISGRVDSVVINPDGIGIQVNGNTYTTNQIMRIFAEQPPSGA